MKKKLLSVLRGFITPGHLFKRTVIVVIACSLMAFSMSWLTLTDLGTDTFTNLNQAIVGVTGWSFGNWQAFLNVILLLFVLIFGTGNNIGFGTLANMFLIGYEMDFFAVLWEKILPAGLFDTMGKRVLLMIPGLALFIFSCAVYMDIGLGTSPCDAISFIVRDRWLKKVPFFLIRMGYDFSMIAIAFLFSRKIYPITVLMSLFMGSAVEFTGRLIKRFLPDVDQETGPRS